jgi:anti-sigma factor (TIGR02949 family)
MDCKTCSGLIEAYLDDELDRADARKLEAHLETCAECRAALERADELRRALRDPSLRHAAPASLRERIAASAHATSPARRVPPGWLRYAAACVIAFGAGGVAMRLWHSAETGTAAQEQVDRDLFAAHWRALAATSPMDVVSTDQHTVKPWFAGKVPESPLVRDFAAQGFPLAGGRIDYVGGARVPVLVYRHGQHWIDVFVFPSGAALPPATQAQGYRLVPIRLGDQAAAIVTDMDATELTVLIRLLTSPG